MPVAPVAAIALGARAIPAQLLLLPPLARLLQRPLHHRRSRPLVARVGENALLAPAQAPERQLGLARAAAVVAFSPPTYWGRNAACASARNARRQRRVHQQRAHFSSERSSTNFSTHIRLQQMRTTAVALPLRSRVHLRRHPISGYDLRVHVHVLYESIYVLLWSRSHARDNMTVICYSSAERYRTKHSVYPVSVHFT